MFKLFKKPEYAFLTIASFFGLLMLLFVPILSAPDECQHFQVEYAMFNGGQPIPEDIILNEQMVLDKTRQNYFGFFTENQSIKSSNISLNLDNNSVTFDGKTPASIQKNIMRIPPAIGVLIGRIIHPSIGSAATLGRAFNFILYILVVFVIIKYIKVGKWTMFIIALTPMMMQQAASLSYDTVNVLAIFIWISLIVNISVNKKINKKYALAVFSSIVLLLVSKSNNIILIPLIFIPLRHLILEKIRSHKLYNSRHWKKVKIISVMLLSILAIAAVYILFKKILYGHKFIPRQFIGMLLNTFVRGTHLALIDTVVIGTVGFFGSFYYHLPMWTVIVYFTVLSLVSMNEFKNISKKLALSSGFLFISSILLISIGMFYAWAMQPFRFGPLAQVADGIQGRYFTPLLILLSIFLGYVAKKINLSFNKRSIPYISIFTTVALLTLYIFQTIDFYC